MKKRPNEHYMSRGKNGKEQTYAIPSKLLNQGYAYFGWCNTNPLYKKEAIKSGTMAGTIIDIPAPRPYTIVGLCVYCGISERTFKSYEDQDQFRPIIEHLKEIVKQNQLEGATSNLYNASIISRLLELTDKQELTGNETQAFIIKVNNPKTKDEIEALKQTLEKAHESE